MEAVRRYAKTLPVVSVSDLVEFREKETDLDHRDDSGQNPFFLAKAQAQRAVTDPYHGWRISQRPHRILVFSVQVAEGCDEMNIGMCWYPPYSWFPPISEAEQNQGQRKPSHVTPAARGLWSSYSKTLYSNRLVTYGWFEFATAHLSVLTVLRRLKDLGFMVEVSDEGGFWQSRSLRALAKVVTESDASLSVTSDMVEEAAASQVLTDLLRRLSS